VWPDRSAQSAASSEKLTFVPGPFSLRSPQAPITFDNYPLTDHRSRFAQLSRLQRIYPRTWSNCNPPARNPFASKGTLWPTCYDSGHEAYSYSSQADPVRASRALGPRLSHREDASLQRLQPTVTTSTLPDRSVLESPPSRAFAEERSFHAARSAEAIADSMIEWSLD
jgi:hypothetical protein